MATYDEQQQLLRSQVPLNTPGALELQKQGFNDVGTAIQPADNTSRFEQGFKSYQNSLSGGNQAPDTTQADISSPGASQGTTGASGSYTKDDQGNVFDAQGNHVTLDQLPKGPNGKPLMNLETLPLRKPKAQTGINEVSSGEAKGIIDQYTPPEKTQPSPAVTNFLTQDQGITSIIKDFHDFMSSQNQRQSLTDIYKQALKDTGIQEIDTQLLNMKHVMEGSEQDIRDEVTKAGGFATESQIQALTDTRNKLLIKNYNMLLDTRNNKENYLNTFMGLTEKDRAEADKRIETGLNFETKIVEMGQKMQENATSKAQWLVGQIGFQGILNATNGDPYYQGLAEQALGLPQGGLTNLAQGGITTPIGKETALKLSEKYPDAGILPSDTFGQIQEKISGSPTYAADLRYKEARAQRLAGLAGGGASGAVSDTAVKNAVQQVVRGLAAPSQFPGFGQNSLKAKVLASLAKDYPNFDLQAAEANFTAKQSYTRYINSATYQNVIKYLNSLVGGIDPNTGKKVTGNLDEVIKLSDNFKRSFFLPINKAYIFAKAQTGNPQAAAYEAAITEVSDQIAKILQGGGTGSGTSDSKLQQAQDLLNKNFSAKQFKSVATELRVLLENRRRALEQDTFKTIQTQVTQENQTKQANEDLQSAQDQTQNFSDLLDQLYNEQQ